jgi:hypothetical protein
MATMRISNTGRNTANFNRGNSVKARREVVPSGTDLTPVFQSDWSTATGTSASAQSDGGKWETVATGLTVVANPGTLGFPATMANLLDVPWNGAFAFCRTESLGVPSVGVTRYYRWYFRLEIPDGVADAETHPVQDGYTAADVNWMFKAWHNLAGAGQWRIDFEFLVNDYPFQRWAAINTYLNKNQTYRIEYALERTGATTQKSDIRVYDSSNALVLDASDFFREDSVEVTLLSADHTFTFRNVNALVGLNAGSNDGGAEVGRYAYQGGFAVCDDQGWIGAYGSVTGEA